MVNFTEQRYPTIIPIDIHIIVNISQTPAFKNGCNTSRMKQIPIPTIQKSTLFFKKYLNITPKGIMSKIFPK